MKQAIRFLSIFPTWLLHEYSMDDFSSTDVLLEKTDLKEKKQLKISQITQDICSNKNPLFHGKIVSVRKSFMKLMMVFEQR